MNGWKRAETAVLCTLKNSTKQGVKLVHIVGMDTLSHLFKPALEVADASSDPHPLGIDHFYGCSSVLIPSMKGLRTWSVAPSSILALLLITIALLIIDTRQ